MHLIFFSFMLALSVHLQAYETNEFDPEYVYSPEDMKYDNFFYSVCTPIQFTKSGIRSFFQETFNQIQYAKEILPHTMNHCIQFLDYGKNTNQNKAYMQSVLKLFGNKLKSCAYVTTHAACQILNNLPSTLGPQLKEETACSWLKNLKNQFKNIFYNTFLYNFSSFRESPDVFFDNLSETLTQQLRLDSLQEIVIEKEQLHQQTIRFLETMLSKLVWTPNDQQYVWQSVKQISEKLYILMDQQLINHDELDDLLRSLIERFIHFLDLTGSEFSLPIIVDIKKDLTESNLIFGIIEEQEEFLESKIERLQKAVLQTEAKVHARMQGIVTEIIP